MHNKENDQVAELYQEIVGNQRADSQRVESQPPAIDRISVLGDLSNAARDKDIVQVILSKPNGQRLYTLFVEAISQEIEMIMGGNKAVDQSLINASHVAAQVNDTLNRLMHNIGNIERSQVLGILNMFLQKIGNVQAEQQHYQPPQQQYYPQQQQYYPPPPQQPNNVPPQQPRPQEYTGDNSERTRRRNGGGLGTP